MDAMENWSDLKEERSVADVRYEDIFPMALDTYQGTFEQVEREMGGHVNADFEEVEKEARKRWKEKEHEQKG